MKSNLILYTSYVSRDNIERAKKRNLLPVFILRNIRNSEVIGKYSGTALHLYSLAPGNDLYHLWRDGEITTEEYKKRYIIEVSSIGFQDIIEKLEYLAKICGASGVVLMGYGENYGESHRSALVEVLNFSGLLENKVCEITL